MMHENGEDFDLYLDKIRQLGLILDQLTRNSRVIWLNQYPTFDRYANSKCPNAEIHSEKIFRYNEAVRGILK